MSLLRDEDAPLHYGDGSHRWVAPSAEQQDAWTAKVKMHLEEHQRLPDAGYVPRPKRRT
jgi:hypothetical protein